MVQVASGSTRAGPLAFKDALLKITPESKTKQQQSLCINQQNSVTVNAL